MSGGGAGGGGVPPQTLGGHSRCGWVLGPSLDKIIKNVSWRKHSQLVTACKSALDKLDSLVDDPLDPASCSPLYGISSPDDADFVLHPIILALDSASPKVVEPALDCAFRLFSFGIIRCEIEVGTPPPLIFRIIDSVCKCGGSLDEEAVELGLLRVLLSAVRSPYVIIRGDCLVHIVRSCYNVYLGGLNGTNQICAKSVLAQMMVLVFTRVEEDSMAILSKTVSVADLLEFTDRNLNEGSSIQFAQDFINEIMDTKAKEVLPDSKLSLLLENGDIKKSKGDMVDDESREGAGLDLYSKIREDGFMLFKNLCKLSMKFSSPEHTDDQILLRGKILSLELLKVVMDNAGPIWLSDERFLNAIKQFLCLSLLKNSALSVMTIFQLLCSIFENLLSKYRPGLKSEIGIFFPMLILRVLENVLQPSFLQKMTVLSLLDKISQDPKIIVDIFVNYDCDVDAPNIFERTVNGLHKTALGPPPGSATTLSPAQDLTFRLESVKCLVRIINSMGTWMDSQLKLGESNPAKFSGNDSMIENTAAPNEDGNLPEYDLHLEESSEFSNAVTLEQRRAYKLEIQKGVSLFNRKPSKGIEFLMNTRKIGNSPEEVVSFLKNTSGLNATMIGDYLGERDEFALKVMHAYVDSFNFEQMNFGEAIRYFLRGFRLPGEAQKIDRIMEKFAERYCKCNPNSFTSAETAYVLAYSVIMLNTDAHNSMVKDKVRACKVFAAAAADERKNIVLLAFETMEKIVREYFPYITETETVTFTDCVRCLIAFTNSRFNSDVSLNAIAFLRFCAVKLADGGLVCNEKSVENDMPIQAANNNTSDVKCSTKEDGYMSFWHPLLTGLSGLSSDPRLAIRKSALEVLFNILKDHGHLFSHLFWDSVFNSVIFPIFNSARDKTEAEFKDYQSSPRSGSLQMDRQLWDSETSAVAAQCLADLFINFFDVGRSQLPGVVSILVGFIRSPGQGPASTGVSSLMHLAGELRGRLSEEEWQEIFLALQDAAASSVPNFLKLLQTMSSFDMSDISESNNDVESSDEVGSSNDYEGDNLQMVGYVVSRMKGHIGTQLLILQVATDLCKMRRQSLSAATVTILLGIYSSITSHAHQLKSDGILELKLQRACSILEIPEPPLLHFENESFQNYINFLHDLLVNYPALGKEKNIEAELVFVCERVLRIYLDCAAGGLQQQQQPGSNKQQRKLHWILPLGSAKKEELAARTPLVLSVLHVLSALEGDTFKKYASQLFPLLVDLVRSEHSSGEVQQVLSGVFRLCIGPLIIVKM
ncbi:unnamed protein product [Cuscuta campestris]|uniref:SEC7 domain-containing protein n=1 Tax=Cuscuta campestris TaxID=132261 RepID=A0A484MTT4_9ASTE|nr:unnamed protein product [Cuscuta campestris]